MKKTRRFCGYWWVTLGCLVGIRGWGDDTVTRPNVVMLVADDLRPDVLGALGGREARTPNLDRLARQGTVLTHATCAYPLCYPSRAEMLTGCTSFRTGVGFHKSALDRDVPTWPQAMQRAGYRTFHIGKWHISGRPSQRGFDAAPAHFGSGKRPDAPQFDHRGQEVTGYVGWQFQTEDGQRFPERGVGLTPDISQTFADAAIEVIRSGDPRPFYLHVDFTAPHDPRLFPTGYQGRYDPARLKPPANFLEEHPFDHGNLRGRDEVLLPFPRTMHDLRSELAAYYAVVTHLDDQIGRILQAIDETRQADNTVVIFTSDHGLAVGSHGLIGKQNMYEHSIRVPLFFRGPGIGRGARSPQLCYLRDLWPTVNELCGIDPPAGIDGHSMAGALRGKPDTVYPYVIGYFQKSQRMIRTDRWKLIWYPHLDREQLFDLRNDADEMQDLSGKPEVADTQSQLRDLLDQWLAERGDPVAAP